MSPTEAGIYGFLILVALMFLKIPVGFVMALVGLGGFAYLVTWDAALQLIAQAVVILDRLAADRNNNTSQHQPLPRLGRATQTRLFSR